MTILDVLDKFLKPWAYDYSIGSNVVHVTRGNVDFIRYQLEQHGFKYIKVFQMVF